MAKSMAISFTLLLAAPAVRAASVVARDLQTLREKPVAKVVRLLQDMAVELQHELEDDRQVHETFTCWCKENEKQKTKAIELGESSISQLEAMIEEAKAKVAELKEKRKATLDDVYGNQKSLDQATELRMNSNKAFHQQEKDMLSAVAATKQAITVLGKSNPQLAQVRFAARRLHAAQVPRIAQAAGAVNKDQLHALQSFLQQATQVQADSFLGVQSLGPEGGQIFGILNQMLEDFEHNLTDAQKAEQKAVADFETVKAAKQDEIAIGQQTVTQLDSSIAENNEKFARASKQLQDTKEQLVLDRTFLANLQVQCENAQAEFDARVKSRTDEISAVQDAVSILNSDEAYATFNSALSLLQTGSLATTQEKEKHMRKQLSALLSGAAARAGAPALALLAMSAQLDTFGKVKEAIDGLVNTLKQQQKDEVAHRDWCTDEFANNDRATAAADDKSASLQTKVADLAQTIKVVSKDIADSTAAVAELQLQMKRASETREAENADFQQTIVDQHLTQEILTKALKRLQQVYAFFQHRKPGAAHTQTSGTKTDPGNGPARFNEYSQNAGGSKAVQLIEEIIADSVKTAAEAQRSEQDSQAAYENFMKDSNKSIASLTKAISDLSGSKSSSEESLVLAKTDLKQVMQELENLSETAQDLHKSCDFVTRNFEARQAARTAEMDALSQAKNILSGMK